MSAYIAILLNLAVWKRIAKLPNLIPHPIFQLYMTLSYFVLSWCHEARLGSEITWFLFLLHVAPGRPTLKDLITELLRCKAASWEDIGILLAVDDGELQAIKSDNTGKSSSCLREMLRKWLTKASPAPSWTAIVEVLEKLGDEELARKLKSKYC